MQIYIFEEQRRSLEQMLLLLSLSQKSKKTTDSSAQNIQFIKKLEEVESAVCVCLVGH